VFKKLFLILFFLLTVSFNQKETEVYTNWQTTNSGYWMYRNGYNVYSNFDYMISRSVYPDSYGYYTFYFWFYSQSYYWDGRNPIYTSTNVRNITVHIYDITGEKLVSYDYSPIGITFNNQFSPYSLNFKTRNRTPIILIRWGYMSAV